MNTRRPPYANKIIARVHARQQTARDNAKLIAAGLTLPAPEMRGHSALHRKLAIDAYGQRLQMLMQADFERHAERIGAFLGALVEDMDAGHLQDCTRTVPAPARLQ